MSAKRVFWIIVVGFALAAMFAAGWVTARTGMGSRIDEASLTDRERAFIAQMRAATLVGHFTIDGREEQPARPDRYDIASVSKVGEELWQFNARMRHDDFDVTLPMTVPLRFVGDTPMVLMTAYSLPPLGTFTVRLFFYGDRYAGTWQHGAIGGLMYGRIEKTATK